MNIKKLVVIYIDALRREYPYCYVLQKGFEALGYRVFLASRRNLNTILKIITPEILIVSHSFTLPEPLFKKVKNKTDVYLLSVEAVGDQTYQYQVDFPEKIDCRRFKGIFLWNDVYKKWLIKERGVDENKVFAFGSPRVELAQFAEKKKNSVVGFIGRFEFINPYYSMSMFESLLSLEEERKHFLNRWIAEIEGIMIYKDLIDHLISKGYTVSLRPHPNEDTAKYGYFKNKYKENIIIDTEFDFIEWIKNIDIVVGTLSTALTEAFLLNKVIISIDGMFKDNYMVSYDKEMEAYSTIAYVPKSLTEIKSLFETELKPKKNTPEMEAYLSRHYNINESGGFNGMSGVVSTIHKNSGKKKSSSVKYFSAFLLFYFTDIGKLLWDIKQRQFRLNIFYNYCFCFHKPTTFMRKAAAQFVEKLQSKLG